MVDVSRLFTPEFHANPHPVYHEIRAEGPLLPLALPGFETWLATGYEVVASILRDGRFRSGFPRDAAQGEDAEWAARSPTTFHTFQRMMLMAHGADHARLRGLVSRAFTPRTVERLRPRIEKLVDELLDAAAARGEIDLLRDFAFPLPVTVIAELFGIPAEDAEKLRRWSVPLAQILDGMTRGSKLLEAEAAALEMQEYLGAQFAHHRARPGEGLIDGLLAARDQDDRLSEDELFAACMLLLLAGHETTTHLVGNGVLALLRQRSEWERLCRDPELAAGAVEECLRYDGPVQFTSRRPVGDVEVLGRRIRDDQEVLLVLAAANRDPARFPDPDRLDITRRDDAHLAFGHGAHFCLGASLARLEATLALGALARRFPRLELATDEPARRAGFAIRALVSLPVRLGA
jgi:cytochrome P450